MVHERRVFRFPALALLCAIGIGLLLSACSERPKTLDGVLVPSSVLTDEAMIMENTKIVGEKTWYAYEKTQDYEWYATRYLRDRDGDKVEQWTIRGLSTSSEEDKLWRLGCGFEVEDKTFYGSRTEQTTRKGASSMYNILATGIVNDQQAVRVVGTTKMGRTASVTVKNTCWYLIMPNAEVGDSWKTVEAHDAADNVLHTLTFRSPLDGES